MYPLGRTIKLAFAGVPPVDVLAATHEVAPLKLSVGGVNDTPETIPPEAVSNTGVPPTGQIVGVAGVTTIGVGNGFALYV